MRISRLVVAVTLTGACQETVAPRLPVAVVPSTLLLPVGDTARLATTDSRVRVTWRSAVPAVATVDASGLVTAVAPGTADIWGVRGVDSAAASVRVIGIKCIGAPSVSPPNATLAVGDTLRIATFLASSCSAVIGPVDWIVSDAAVASITSRPPEGTSQLGVVTARGVGTAVITARSVEDPTISATMALVVKTP
jgi:uncharacterized protein YjdB